MHEHLEAAARDPEDGLDSLLRHELHWQAPPELTTCLLGLIPNAPLMALALARPRPQSWYSILVLILTSVAVGLSLAVAWQIYGALGTQLGLASVLESLRDAPLIGLQRLYETLPASRQLVAMLVAVRDQIHWLLLAVILWLALDGWQPRLRRASAGR